MYISTEMVERLLKEIQEYARSHFGIPYGEDFPEFAKILSESKGICNNTLVSMMLLAITGVGDDLKMAVSLAAKGAPIGTVEAAVVRHPMFWEFVQYIYLGYKLGKEVAEKQELEKLASK